MGCGLCPVRRPWPFQRVRPGHGWTWFTLFARRTGTGQATFDKPSMGPCHKAGFVPRPYVVLLKGCGRVQFHRSGANPNSGHVLPFAGSKGFLKGGRSPIRLIKRQPPWGSDICSAFRGSTFAGCLEEPSERLPMRKNGIASLEAWVHLLEGSVKPEG